MGLQLGEAGARDGASTPAGPDARGEEGGRAAIVDALVACFAEGETSPTPRAVAERAGVSLGAVMHQLSDLEALCAAVFQRQISRVWSRLEPLPPSDTPLEARVDALVEQRAALFEAISPIRRAAGEMLPSSPTLARGLARSAAFLRRQVSEIFGPELAGMDGPDGVAAVDFAASWAAWDALRRVAERSVDGASRTMRVTLLALLDPR